MDNRNVFVAIALSMSVLLFGELFLRPQKKPVNSKDNQIVEQNLKQGQ